MYLKRLSNTRIHLKHLSNAASFLDHVSNPIVYKESWFKCTYLLGRSVKSKYLLETFVEYKNLLETFGKPRIYLKHLPNQVFTYPVSSIHGGRKPSRMRLASSQRGRVVSLLGQTCLVCTKTATLRNTLHVKISTASSQQTRPD